MNKNQDYVFVNNRDIHKYFINIAALVSARSTCIPRKVGAIITKNKRIIATGYNGTPKGYPNCNKGGCPRCKKPQPGKNLEKCYCNHAEENAITQCARFGTSCENCTLYTLYSPCLNCAKLIINSGITKVIYLNQYTQFKETKELFKKTNVQFLKT